MHNYTKPMVEQWEGACYEEKAGEWKYNPGINCLVYNRPMGVGLSGFLQ